MRAVHRTIVAAILSALFALAFTGTALAQQAYPPNNAVTCDTADVTAGSTFTCQASGFNPDSTVSAQATGETTGSSPWTFNTTAQANSQGVVTVTIQVPDNATGPASVSFSGLNFEGTATRVLSNAVAVNVTQPGAGGGTTTTGGAVAATGSDVTGGIVAVVALIGVGGLLLVVTRRRKHVKA